MPLGREPLAAAGLDNLEIVGNKFRGKISKVSHVRLLSK